MAEIKVTRKDAEMSHGKTRYFEAGSGPDVLLIHGVGFTSGGDTWLPLMPALGEHFHLVAPDCLGFGPGDVLEQPYSFGYMVDHLREFQDVVGISRSHVIGRSMGGWLSMLLAYESPERVGSVVNVAGGGVVTRPLPGMVNWAPPNADQIRKNMENFSGTNIDVEELIDERIALAVDPVHTDAFKRLMVHMSDGETRNRYNTVRRMPHVTAPTLVFWGTNDQTNAIELGHQTHELIPGSEMIVLEGAGHGLTDERPKEFTDAVIAFLS